MDRQTFIISLEDYIGTVENDKEAELVFKFYELRTNKHKVEMQRRGSN
jgi:hypothetical protein